MNAAPSTREVAPSPEATRPREVAPSPEAAPIASNLHMAWARLLLRSLARAGVRDVVVSPGSRSTPLALAAHESPDLRSRFVLDERSAAFFALGQARVTGRPTVLVCTSGTAAAHYYPAVIEAATSAVPMIVITADRPWEMQRAGASQTIDQTRLFGDFARAYLALGAPEPGEAALRAVARTAAQAVARALGPDAGPVQINAPFRKPLEPVAAPEREPWSAAWEHLMETGPTRSIAAASALDPASIEDIARLLAHAERGLLVCGPAPAHGDVDAHRREIAALARLTGFPILAEATSQSRFGLSLAGRDAAVTVVSTFDTLLRSPAFRRRFAPDAILEIGAPPTSAGYAQLLAENPRCPRIVVASPGWTDPTSTSTAILHVDLPAFHAALRVHLADLNPARSATWSRSLAAADARACAIIDESLTTSTLTEAAVARAVIEACPPNSTLVLGNSSPVRDVDTYCPASSKPLRVLHQRGASGIDGLVSGAAGAGSVSSAPVTLFLGDLSLLHDIGGLALARGDAPSPPLVIVTVNNGGGRIFEQLPVGRALAADAFERCFATPQRVDLAAAAAAFGVAFERAATPADLASALSRAHARAACTLVEAVVPPHDAAERLRAIWSRASDLAASPAEPPDPLRNSTPRKEEAS